jgi:hypothetical protein
MSQMLRLLEGDFSLVPAVQIYPKPLSTLFMGLTVRMEPKKAMRSFVAPALSSSGKTGALECNAIDLQGPH